MKKYLLLLLLSCQASAVLINPKGVGEFLVIPYYTVNNGLNTLVNVTNTTEKGKAVKINFREGLNGHAVLSYNVYLDAYDSWTFGLIATNSTVPGFVGQDSAFQITMDQSCAPFLNKSRQEFLPFELLDGSQDMQRAREGYIEIIEMGELSESLAEALNFSSNSTLAENCAALDLAWTNGFWNDEVGQLSPEQMNPVTGGLSAEVNIINVAEGINYSIPVTTLADFFAEGSIAHSNPADTSLSFDAAKPEAYVVTEDGVFDLGFDTGTDAVSALFMADYLISNYELTPVVASESETIIAQPTRRFYVNDDNISAPFSDSAQALNCDMNTYGGSQFELKIFDREGNFQEELGGHVLRPPEPPACGAVFSYSISSEATAATQSILTGSRNFINVVVDLEQLSIDSGFIRTDFIGDRSIIGRNDNDEPVEILGTPLLGLTLQKYTNAGAMEGLLAQYGSSHPVKHITKIAEN